ncbi:MAG: hypothetical protein ACFCD0_27975 [Gemmataceae bacterium]
MPRSLLILVMFLITPSLSVADAAKKPAATQKRSAKIGQILIRGNTRTPEWMIRQRLPLYPGQTLQFPFLRIAERDLSHSMLFVVDKKRGIRPTVTVLVHPDSPNSEFVDILVSVKERKRDLVRLVGVASAHGLFIQQTSYYAGLELAAVVDDSCRTLLTWMASVTKTNREISIILSQLVRSLLAMQQPTPSTPESRVQH